MAKKTRYSKNIAFASLKTSPTSLFNFLSTIPGSIPCVNLELCVYLDARLSGVTFLDVGAQATSAVYAMFDPAELKRSLGIFMMLQSIEFSLRRGCCYYYPWVCLSGALRL
jgi:arginine-tRNA-protein transferase